MLVKAALKRARAAGREPFVEELILRAATYTPQELEQLAAKLPALLRGPVIQLLQRDPAARYQTAQEAELALRAGLERLGVYGAPEAAEEIADKLAAAGAQLVAAEGGLAPNPTRRHSHDAVSTL